MIRLYAVATQSEQYDQALDSTNTIKKKKKSEQKLNVVILISRGRERKILTGKRNCLDFG